MTTEVDKDNDNSWSIDLWDQIDALMRFEGDQINLLDLYGKMFSEVQKLEHDFGKRLRKTLSLHQLKKKSDSDEVTTVATFETLVRRLMSMGVYFETSAKDLNDVIISGFKNLCDSEKKLFENQKSSYNKMNNNLEQSRKHLDSNWQKYVTAYREKQKAYENWQKAQEDMQLARIDQQKFQEIYHRKERALEDVRQSYASELSKYNNSQRQYYNKHIVDCLEEMDMRNRNRTDKAKEILLSFSQISEKLTENLLEFNRLTKEAIDSIDAAKDARSLIGRLKTEFHPPASLPFIDLDICPASLLDGPPQQLGAYMLGLESSKTCAQLSCPATGGSTGMLSGLKRGKDEASTIRSPFVCDISIRPLKDKEYTIIQLDERLKELKDLYNRTEGERQGTVRLLEAYRNNANLGNYRSVIPKQLVLQRRLNSIRERTQQLETRFNDLGGDGAYSDAQRCLSRMQQGGAGEQPQRGFVPQSVTSVVNADSDDSFDSDDQADGPTPGAPDSRSSYVGRAVAKYEFAGNGPNYLAIKPGDAFQVVRLDTDGSGWTTVVSEDGSRKGFVPTGFMDITTF